MKAIITVFKKELLDTLRDQKTLMLAILMPVLLIPILLFGFVKVGQMSMNNAQNKTLKIALIDAPPAFQSKCINDQFELISGLTKEKASSELLIDSLDALISFEGSFLNNQKELKTTQVNMWYKSTNITVLGRLNNLIDGYEKELLSSRIVALNISADSIDPLAVESHDITPQKEMLGETIGGFLPYIFILFCFLGCSYPALDLITGEKEKGTIETLLTVPTSRFSILMGKVLTIALVGLVTATMTIFGMIAAINFLPDIPTELMEAMRSIVTVKFVAMLFGMLAPLCIFFAGLISALVVNAKSFKEAQSIVTPVSLAIIVPAALAMSPGIELSWKTAFIPILNIALATKEIIASRIQIEHYTGIVASLVLLAIIAVAISHRHFSKERMIF